MKIITVTTIRKHGTRTVHGEQLEWIGYFRWQQRTMKFLGVRVWTWRKHEREFPIYRLIKMAFGS